MENTGQIVDSKDGKEEYKPSEADKELVAFVVDHTDKWRDYRNQNFQEDWDRYERVYRGIWAAEDKNRESERSRIISPATQQAVETAHAETMEAIFGQGEYFDIEDDIHDVNGNPLDVEMLKKMLYEDFAQDKIRKSIDHISLLGKIYGTGIGEIVVGKEKQYIPATKPVDQEQVVYGVEEKDRIYVRLVPINPKNFIFDPNGTSIDECMGVGIERYISTHKITQGMVSGKYRKCDISSMYEDDSNEPTQEDTNYQLDKMLVLTYYGLVPREYLNQLKKEDEEEESSYSEELEDYTDMVEAIIVIANGTHLLKAEESPYMMKDRPVISYQDDTVPGRLLGRGVVEKAFNMQMAIDGSMRSHMDSLALTVAPMVAMDATRLPRGAKFEVKPGKAFMTNGSPQDIIYPFNFGTNDGAALNVSKEFERMLLMATGTLDSQGMVSQSSRDAGGINMAVAGIIKKYKRTITNFQEDFLIPFVKKAAFRYMQFDPERYPSVDMKFIPTATLGIMAREYEQQQLAFMVQTLGADSPITPILMKGILKNSSLSSREEMIQQMDQAAQPDPQQQQLAQQKIMMEMELVKAQIGELQSKANMNNGQAQLNVVKAQLEPESVKAEVIAAFSKNLPDEDAAANAEFDRRAKISELMLKEEEIMAKKKMVEMQMAEKKQRSDADAEYLSKVQKQMNG